MADDYLDSFFREIYATEISHKDKLDAADNLPAGVLIFLSGVGIYYLKILPVEKIGMVEVCFWIFGTLFAMLFGVATVSVLASVWPRYKAYISSPEELDIYVKGLEEYHRYYQKEDEATRRIASDLRVALRKQFVEASTVNRNLNKVKMKWQTRSRYWIAAAIAVVWLNAYPTFYIQHKHSQKQNSRIVRFPEIQKVQIVSFIPESDSDGDRTGQASANTPTASEKAGPAKDRDPEGRPKQDKNQEQEMKGNHDMSADKIPQSTNNPDTSTAPPAKPEPPPITKVKGGADLEGLFKAPESDE